MAYKISVLMQISTNLVGVIPTVAIITSDETTQHPYYMRVTWVPSLSSGLSSMMLAQLYGT